MNYNFKKLFLITFWILTIGAGILVYDNFRNKPTNDNPQYTFALSQSKLQLVDEINSDSLKISVASQHKIKMASILKQIKQFKCIKNTDSLSKSCVIEISSLIYRETQSISLTNISSKNEDTDKYTRELDFRSYSKFFSNNLYSVAGPMIECKDTTSLFNAFNDNILGVEYDISTFRLHRENKKRELLEVDKSITQINDLANNDTLIYIAIPIFAISVIVILSIPMFYREKDIQELIIGRGMLVETSTIFLLTATILILGIGRIINSEVLGTLLGGISVYVLQRRVSTNNTNDNTENEQPLK